MFKKILLTLTLVLTMTTQTHADTMKNETAILAGGCFWCIESDLEKLDGVKEVVSGYTGGEEANPAYERVAMGVTGHREAVRVEFDPEKTSYEDILNIFWRSIDLFDDKGQFCDKGFQYTAAVYYTSDAQKEIAERTKKDIQSKFDETVVTAIEKSSTFYDAEDYHQDYYKKNPIRYKFYRFNCGRDQRIEEIWANAKK